MRDYTDKEKEEIRSKYGNLSYAELVAIETTLKEGLYHVHTFMDRIGRIELTDNR